MSDMSGRQVVYTLVHLIDIPFEVLVDIMGS